MFRSAVITLFCLCLSGLSAYAADTNGAEPAGEASAKAPAATVDWSLPRVEFTPFAKPTPAPAATGNVDWSLPSASADFETSTSRPRVLPVLYVSLALLQAYDVYSTSQGLARGAKESNPLMQHVAGNPAGFVAIKALTTAVPMVLAERMWRHNNKKGAVMLMIVANGVAAAIGANNAQVLRQIR